MFVYSSLDCLWLFLLCGNDVLVSALFCVCVLLTFLVMMLMFMVHLWLPMAHTEAGVAGFLFVPHVFTVRTVTPTYMYCVSIRPRNVYERLLLQTFFRQ